MEKYYTMVMDLYRDAITGNYQVNQSTEVKKELYCSITASRIKGEKTEVLEDLIKRINELEEKQ